MSSPDRIIGVAVIDETTKPYTLYVWCESWSNGQKGVRRVCTIPVVARGLPHVGREWDYEQHAGGKLKVTPSLRMLAWKDGEPDLFHNDGEWWIPYQIHDGKHKDEWRDAGDQFRAANGMERYQD